MQKIICDICGKDTNGVYDEQNLFIKSHWGKTKQLDLCYDCTKELSILAQPLIQKMEQTKEVVK
jgi:hypothetical protein